MFLEEAAELVPQVGRDLRDWRADPTSRLIPESLKRLLHTLKGSARMVGAMAIGELTHAMETRVVNVGELGSIPDSLFEELESRLRPHHVAGRGAGERRGAACRCAGSRPTRR